MKTLRLWNRLSIKLLLAIGISFLASTLVFLLVSQYYMHRYFLQPNQVEVSQYNLTMLVIFSLTIATFIISFLWMTKNKLRYLRNITERVQRLASGQLGTTVEVKGRDELATLSEHINQMSQKLKQQFEYEREMELAKHELITSISHDLRTPLTSIIGYVDLLEKELGDKGKAREYLDTIHSKSVNLKNLIDELFEYTKLNSPDVRLEPKRVKLGSVLEQLIGEYIPILEQEGLTVEKRIEEDVHVTVDVEKMVRVYENLLMNATKYSMKPSLLKIELTTASNNAIFKLSNRVDKMPGNVDKWFDRFYRGDLARTDDGGTGLGLAISKRIVELHGGEIKAVYADGWITVSIVHRLSTKKATNNTGS